MGKNKLRKFKDLESNPLVLQYPFARLAETPFPLRGRWREDFFHNSNPIVLELGCGKGEYTVGLARRYPDSNFIGIDIKGARMWTGATEAVRCGMTNVAFLRTSIELLGSFFAPGEIDSIWITFPDPQMRKVNKRLTGTRMLALYRTLLAAGGTVHLKTDSPFLYAYTTMMATHNGLDITAASDDIYSLYRPGHPLVDIRTHYEQQWLDRGLTIKYLSFKLNKPDLTEPPEADTIEPDTYRSYSRGYIQMPGQMDEKPQ